MESKASKTGSRRTDDNPAWLGINLPVSDVPVLSQTEAAKVATVGFLHSTGWELQASLGWEDGGRTVSLWVFTSAVS